MLVAAYGAGIGPMRVTTLERRLTVESCVESAVTSSIPSLDDGGTARVDGRLDGCRDGQLNFT